MTREFEVTAEELVRTLQRRGIPLPSEIGAFVVLEACERLLGRPALLRTRDIFITEQGDVECAERPRYETEADAVTALLGVLAELLVGAAPGVPNMLLDLVEHGPNEQRLTLALLRSDLEACLLPLNRGATRRVLSRLVREVRKGGASPSEPAEELDLGDVDATFDDLMSQTAAPPAAAARVLKVPSPPAGIQISELPRGIGGGLPRGVGSELPRGVTSQRPDASAPGALTAAVAHDAPRAVFGQAALSQRESSDGEEGASRLLVTDVAPGRRRNVDPSLDLRSIGSEATAVKAPRRRGRNTAAAAERAERDSGESAGDAAPQSWSLRTEAVGGEPQRAAADADPEADSGKSVRETAKGRAMRAAAQPDASAPAAAEGGGSSHARRPASEHPSRPAPARSRAPRDVEALVEADAARGRLGLWVFIATTAAAVAMLLAYFALGREQSQSALGFLKPTEREVAAVKAPAPPRRVYGDLRINSKPDRAQVFLLIGPGPAIATDIPLGVAQEFVALSEGYRPARALLPADATWDDVGGQPRYELAIQARPMHEGRRFRAPDALGATLLPQNVGAPSGRLGSVRVVTTPRAAEVYQLIGFTPDVHVDNLPLDHAYELLVYLEGRGSVRKRVEPADFQENVEKGKRVAHIDLQLSAAE